MNKKSNPNIDGNIEGQKIEWNFDKELVDYQMSFDFMQKRVEEIVAGEKEQLIWSLEHPPVYTAGVSADDADLLHKTDVPIFKTNRGGKYTYHCPGMRIIYVMLDLKQFFAPEKPDVSRFVKFLENWVIGILGEFGIKGEIRKNRIGIWVTDENGVEKKIAALGIKLRKWVSYHGIAINIDPDMSGFNNIVPCGISEFGVTSIAEILGKIDEKKLDEVVQKRFEEMMLKREF